MSLWNEPRRGRHHFARALSDNNLVIWVNRQYFKNESFDIKVGPEYINKNLIVLHTSVSFFSQRIDEYLNISNRVRLKLLNGLLRQFGKPDILWAYDYKSINIIRYFRNDVVSLYFCNDFFGEKAYWLYERRLAKTVSHVICTDPRLAERFKPINSSSLFVPHGLWPLSNRPPFSKKKKPHTLGYVGTLNGTVDIEFIEKILDETTCELVLAGPIVECDDSKREGFEKLLKRDRVRYFGVVEQSEINTVLSFVDVCLLPYIKPFNGFALKFFDYLNNAKPILATDYDFVWPQDFKRFVNIYTEQLNLGEFVDLIYQSWDKDHFDDAINLADRSTWRDRIVEISRYLGICDSGVQ